jgi:hypothetical protein
LLSFILQNSVSFGSLALLTFYLLSWILHSRQELCITNDLFNSAFLHANESQNSENPEGSPTPITGEGSPASAADTGNGSTPDSSSEVSSTDTSTTSNSESSRQFPILGTVSLDFSQIEMGNVILLCGGSPMLIINLHYILCSLSRSSRRKLASWLNQKSLPSGFPIGSQVQPSEATPSQAEDTPGPSTVSSSTPGSSTPQTMLSKKLARLLGIDASALSNSLCDSIRQLLKNGSISLAVQNSVLDPSSKSPQKFHMVSWQEILNIGQKNLKSRRTANKRSTAGKKAVSSSKAGSQTRSK